MIWLDDNGHILVKTQESRQTVERILEYQKSLLYLIQTQNKDFFDEEIHYNACELLNNLLPSQEQATKKTIEFIEK